MRWVWVLVPAVLMGQSKDDAALAARLHQRITSGPKADFKDYKATIPGTTVTFAMVAIQGGEFQMGSPETEKHRNKDEGPQHKVKLDAFWMGKFEVSWDEYRLFQFWETNGKEPDVDAVSHPTKPYVEMSFGMGTNGYPAISMTQHAA